MQSHIFGALMWVALHAWGKIYCPYNDKECRCGEFCITSIWSPPKNAGTHAKQIKRVVDNCRRNSQENED